MEFLSAPRSIKVVQVLEKHLPSIAELIEADFYSIEVELKTQVKKVTFSRYYPDRQNHNYTASGRPRNMPINYLGSVPLGDYIMILPKGVDEYMNPEEIRYKSITGAELQTFISQQKSPESDFNPPYDR